MQNLQDIQDKIFFETKTILETLGKIASVDELLAKHDLFSEVTDRVAFLRILEKNSEGFEQIFKDFNDSLSVKENQKKTAFYQEENFDDSSFPEDVIEEEVLFTNELNAIEPEEPAKTPEHEEILPDPNFSKEQKQYNINVEEARAFNEEQHILENSTSADIIAQKERELEETEARRRQIVEISKHAQEAQPTEESSHNEETPLQQAEKKFKLAHIKGLKAVKQIFDNDPLEEEKEMQPEKGSILKTNVQTDFMEAERRKPEFRLDLNDKVAFTKSLFNGNSEELSTAIAELNSFKTLDEAKSYLSELYHERNWAKSDEYAQRLWSLVENKFM
ncbi:hypothetical protein [Kaistella solincola]|uniref:hypothetical protein n=1 Tax=Kaistella solincola TaxID=510955 RepID=UPI0006895655|nr:hypothetical protein [Kaistella solincola]